MKKIYNNKVVRLIKIIIKNYNKKNSVAISKKHNV